jgi:outer membrane protein assembly factor BamB
MPAIACIARFDAAKNRYLAVGFDGGVVEQKTLLAIVLGLVVAALLFLLWRKPSASKISPSPGIPAIEKKWEFTAGGKIFGALAMADDGTLYAAAEDGFVYALRETCNGKPMLVPQGLLPRLDQTEPSTSPTATDG